jgi:hypothetical protein
LESKDFGGDWDLTGTLDGEQIFVLNLTSSSVFNDLHIGKRISTTGKGWKDKESVTVAAS